MAEMAWAPDYVTAAELKAFLRISDSADDADIAIAISAASRAVDDHCNRQFGQIDDAEERVYTARWDYGWCQWVIDIDDLDDASLFATVEAGEIDLYTLEPLNAVLRGKVWTRLVVDEDAANLPTGTRNEVTVEAMWGWAAVPDAVAQATKVQASRFFSRRSSPYGVAGSPDTGSELRLLSRVDPDVGVALRGYRRTRKAG